MDCRPGQFPHLRAPKEPLTIRRFASCVFSVCVLDLTCDAAVSLIRVTALLQSIQHLLTPRVLDLCSNRRFIRHIPNWILRGKLAITKKGNPARRCPFSCDTEKGWPLDPRSLRGGKATR